ncbi:hypothetical protein O9853_08705 [Vibrio lentus]|nr:hypothetical protein [Vibrio lentus]
MKKLILAATIASLSTGVNASIETLDWHEFASPEAQKFAQETIVLDFMPLLALLASLKILMSLAISTLLMSVA